MSGGAILAACSFVFPTKEIESSSTTVQSDASDDQLVSLTDGSSSSSSSSGSADVVVITNPTAPSCSGGLGMCGGETSCCATATVPGGMFFRGFDPTSGDKNFPATIASFRLDVFEVTVGRLRAWTTNGFAKPTDGAGKNRNNATDPGWQSAFNGSVALDANDFKQKTKGCAGSTWTDSAGANENKPANCLTWAEAFAFCIWDGGRLPTEAEWTFAAGGGEEQRVFPWSVGPENTSIDANRAAFGLSGPVDVGTKRNGNARYGHTDLAGNIAEWLLDFKDPFQNPCVNCARLGNLSERMTHGGAFDDPDSRLRVTNRDGSRDPNNRFAKIGVRCARDLP
jgi:formylglycine-generating enzyme